MAIIEGIKRGTIELLILTLLQDQDMYGYQLSQELELRSNKRYTLQESSLYPTLYRLVDKKLISDYTEKVGRRRTRVYYHIEDAGLQYLEVIRKEYLSMCRGIFDILNITNIEMLGGQNDGESTGD